VGRYLIFPDPGPPGCRKPAPARIGSAAALRRRPTPARGAAGARTAGQVPSSDRVSPFTSPIRRSYLLGAAVLLLLGLALLQPGVREAVLHDGPVSQALLAGLVAAAATALGTVPVLVSRTISDRTVDTLMGFGAGVMLAASAFSLVGPALEAATGPGTGRWGAGLTVGAGLLLGAGLLMAIDRLVPHEHFVKGREGRRNSRVRRAWLFVFAIALHNIPEGLAIGVAFAGTDALSASALTMGIAIQNIPEGLIVAVALRAVGYGRLKPALIGMASGLLEPAGAVLGAAVVSLSSALLPWGLAFAAGAMLFVVSHEIIPESHRKGHEHQATAGLMLGFVMMVVIVSAF
jgi:zinc transporter, ZIP family